MTRIANLSEIADVVRGVTFAKSDADTEPAPGKLPVLRAGNIGEQLKLEGDLVFVDEIKISSSQILQQNDIVMCTSSGSADVVGKSAILVSPWKGSFGAFCAVIRANPTEADASFLSHFLKSRVFRRWASGSSGIGIKNIRASDLKNFEIPLPPLEEQKRIAAIIDQADSLRRLRQRAIDRLNTLGQAIFYEMFGDGKDFTDKPLDTIAELKRGPFGGALKKEIFVDHGYKVYEQSHAINKDHSIGKYFIDSYKYREMEAFAVRGDDLIVSCSGTLGRVYRIPSDAPTGVINQALLRIRPDRSSVIPEYLETFLDSQKMQSFLSGFSRGTGLQNFPPMSEVRVIPVPVPPINLQQEFLERKQAVAEQNAVMVASVHRVAGLFSSLQRRAFRGEL
jgi:type I restriction enzyme S subunit